MRRDWLRPRPHLCPIWYPVGSTQACHSAIPFRQPRTEHRFQSRAVSASQQYDMGARGPRVYPGLPPSFLWMGRWLAPGEAMGGGDLPVLQREPGQLLIVVQPLELQRPAALSHAGEHQAVPFQMHLCAHWLRLEVWRHIICGETGTESPVSTCSDPRVGPQSTQGSQSRGSWVPRTRSDTERESVGFQSLMFSKDLPHLPSKALPAFPPSL